MLLRQPNVTAHQRICLGSNIAGFIKIKDAMLAQGVLILFPRNEKNKPADRIFLKKIIIF